MATATSDLGGQAPTSAKRRSLPGLHAEHQPPAVQSLSDADRKLDLLSCVQHRALESLDDRHAPMVGARLAVVVGAPADVSPTALGVARRLYQRVRTDAEASALRDVGADAIVADLRGDVEWTADGCDAAVFAAGARHRTRFLLPSARRTATRRCRSTEHAECFP